MPANDIPVGKRNVQMILVIYVTHIMADAFAMADRIAIMRDGRLVQVGTERQLREHPVDKFVNEFLVS